MTVSAERIPSVTHNSYCVSAFNKIPALNSSTVKMTHEYMHIVIGIKPYVIPELPSKSFICFGVKYCRCAYYSVTWSDYCNIVYSYKVNPSMKILLSVKLTPSKWRGYFNSTVKRQIKIHFLFSFLHSLYEHFFLKLLCMIHTIRFSMLFAYLFFC